MKQIVFAIAAFSIVCATSCKKTEEAPPAANSVTFGPKTYVTDKAYRDTINQALGSLSLISGAHIRCEFKAFPTKDGFYRLAGIKRELDSDEVWVSASVPVRLPITDTSDVLDYSSTSIGNVRATIHVVDGKISISIPSAAFQKYPYPTDTMMLSANLAE